MRSSYSDTASGHCIQYLIHKSFLVDLSAPLRTSLHRHFICLQSKVILTSFEELCATWPWNKVIPKKSRYIDFKIYSRPIRRCQNRGNWIRFGHMVGAWKWYIPVQMKWVWLWPPVSPATVMRQGQTGANSTRLNKLYEMPEYRIYRISARVFPSQMKLTQTPKFRPGTLSENPRMGPEFVLQRPGNRAELPDLLETNFVSPSYIDLWIPLTEFFCNLSVQSL